MAEESQSSSVLDTAIQVCVRVRPLNGREREEGHRVCVSFDEPSKQVVLTAVDKSTLLQLRGSAAKGYAFDKRYGQDETSDSIYEGSVAQLVDSVFKGYNATVLAYGQTGSGKTHTMAGGVGIHGKVEEGVIPRVVRHIFMLVEQIKKKEKSGEKTEVAAYALELYNEDLRDLSAAKEVGGSGGQGWDAGKAGAPGTGLKLQERPVGKDGRVVPEVVGVREQVVATSEDLHKVFASCMENRSTSSTKLNDRSSRSHAIFTIIIRRTIVEVMNELGNDFKAKVRTTEFSSKLHLVDLAGSERVKRSGVTGKELKEATHINSGLLALGNVIVALAGEGEGKKKGHIPYRDSKLTRLLQDSLGGNSLTVLISCISPSEQDFEETNNTLKYANRACNIKNTPLPNKFTTLEEDLLPCMPSAGGASLGMVQLQALLEEHEHIKEMREKRAKEKRERDEKRLAQLDAMREQEIKTPGFQRLRATQYDELRRQLTSSARGSNINANTVIGDDTLRGFGRMRVGGASVDAGPLGGALPPRPTSSGGRAASLRTSRHMPHASSGDSTPPHMSRHGSAMGRDSGTGKEWHADGEGAASVTYDDDAAGGDPGAYDQDDFFEQGEAGGEHGVDSDFFIVDDVEQPPDDGAGGAGGSTDYGFLADDDEEVVAREATSGQDAAPPAEASTPTAVDDSLAAGLTTPEPAAAPAAAGGGKSKFKRGASRAARGALMGDADAQGEPAAMGSETEAEASGQAVELVALDGDDVADDEEEDLVDPIAEVDVPKLLARFKVNQQDTLAVFKASTKEDFKDVISLLPENTPLPASDKMTYLLARLEVHTAGGRNMDAALMRVGTGEASMNEAVGPAVGCLMATFGTNMISSCIFEFDDPPDLKFYTVEERIELWGLQIPHNSVRPSLQAVAAADDGGEASEAPAVTPAPGDGKESIITWSSVDRLNMSIGLLYALCNHANESGIRCGFCVPRPQLLKRWLQAGVKMKNVSSSLKLIYPPSAHDYEYYKASTVAFFMVREVQAALEKVLGIIKAAPGAAS